MNDDDRPRGVRLSRRERADLARRAFDLASVRVTREDIALSLNVSVPTARNLILYGRRLAAGQPEVADWCPF